MGKDERFLETPSSESIGALQWKTRWAQQHGQKQGTGLRCCAWQGPAPQME